MKDFYTWVQVSGSLVLKSNLVLIIHLLKQMCLERRGDKDRLCYSYQWGRYLPDIPIIKRSTFFCSEHDNGKLMSIFPADICKQQFKWETSKWLVKFSSEPDSREPYNPNSRLSSDAFCIYPGICFLSDSKPNGQARHIIWKYMWKSLLLCFLSRLKLKRSRPCIRKLPAWASRS